MIFYEWFDHELVLVTWVFVCGAEPVDWIELKAVHVNQLDECQPELKPLGVLFEWIWFVSGRLVKERGIVLRNTTRAIPSVCYFISQISFVIVSADVFFFSLLRPWLMSQLTELKSENWLWSATLSPSASPFFETLPKCQMMADDVRYFCYIKRQVAGCADGWTSAASAAISDGKLPAGRATAKQQSFPE